MNKAELEQKVREGANLQGANLQGANLQGADLQGANLQGANLYEANLYGANLQGANLYEANLWNCIGNNCEIKTIQADTYVITYTEFVAQIGCQRHTWAEWLAFTDEEIAAMDSGAMMWRSKWKPILVEIMK